MAAALECWSGRASTDEDMVEQVLMKTDHRSETPSSVPSSSSSSSSSVVHRRLQKLSRNFAGAVTNIKNSLNLDSARDPSASKIETCRKVVWGGVVRNLTQLYPGSQLPEKLISNIRKHFDSLPLSYAQANFDMKDVFMHIRLIEQAAIDDHPAILIQEVSDDETQGSVFKLTFACNSSISWPTMSVALDSAAICCKKIQIFEKKGSTLGIIFVLVQSGQEKFFRSRVESALKSAAKKPKLSTIKLPFGLCGCQENGKGSEIGEIGDNEIKSYENGIENSIPKIELQMPLPDTAIVVSVDEWQTIQSGKEEIENWLLRETSGDREARGCDKGNAYDIELRRDLLELMSCGHKCIVQFHGICVDENHGLCVVTKIMEGGSVHELMQKTKKTQTKDVIRIAIDAAEGLKFMNDHGVAYRDLNAHRILLDRQGNACLGNMGIVSVSKNNGEVTEYEMDGYRWLAPEIIAGDPENVAETWMSNAYSFGMVMWEMITGEAAYAAYSPVQAAVGIAACGLRPEIPKDCPQVLRMVMTRCWNSCPSKRPQFSEILNMLLRSSNSR
ncbi:hypothetical protein Syun_000197 [Stephania yunnanensis]|uniref:Protein kinase domain-containing protein n=1 Tax=Stephania yunnanensis TaxID=152371 RepID=A0AAP0LBG8_9MAGN